MLYFTCEKVVKFCSHHTTPLARPSRTRGVYVSVKFRNASYPVSVSGRCRGWVMWTWQMGGPEVGNWIYWIGYLSALSWVKSRSSTGPRVARTKCVMCLQEISVSTPSHTFATFTPYPHSWQTLARFSLALAEGSGNLWITLFSAPLTLCVTPAPGQGPSTHSHPFPPTNWRLSPALTSSNLLCNLLRIWHRTLAGSEKKSRREGDQGCEDAAACVLPPVPLRVSGCVCVCVCICRLVLLVARVQKCPGNSADRQQGQCVLIIVVIISWACSEREANVNIIKIKAVKWTNWVESHGQGCGGWAVRRGRCYFLFNCVFYLFSVCSVTRKPNGKESTDGKWRMANCERATADNYFLPFAPRPTQGVCVMSDIWNFKVAASWHFNCCLRFDLCPGRLFIYLTLGTWTNTIKFQNELHEKKIAYVFPFE